MADPAESDLNLFDLYEQPRDVAAARARARALALQRERAMGLADMYTPVPEFQKAGEAQFARAEKERSAVSERMPESVLKLALEKTNQERQLAMLQQQIAYQNAQLALMARQQKEAERKNVVEEQHQRVLEKPVVPGDILKEEAKNRATVEMLNKAGGVLSFIPGSKKAVDLLKTGPAAQQKAMEGLIKGYRAMGAEVPGENLSPAVPQAPGGAPSMASQGPAPAAGGHSHYRYLKGKTKLTSPVRVPSDGTRDLGPAEPNPEFQK